MITLHWSLFIYIAIIIVGIYLAIWGSKEEYIPLTSLLGIIIIVLSTAIYGGIFWW